MQTNKHYITFDYINNLKQNIMDTQKESELKIKQMIDERQIALKDAKELLLHSSLFTFEQNKSITIIIDMLDTQIDVLKIAYETI